MSYMQLHVITCQYMHDIVLNDVTCLTSNYIKLHVSLLHTITCHHMPIHALYSLTLDYMCYMFLHDVTCSLSDNIQLHPFHRMCQAPAVPACVCRASVPRVWATEVPKESRCLWIQQGKLWNLIWHSSVVVNRLAAACCWRACYKCAVVGLVWVSYTVVLPLESRTCLGTAYMGV